MTVSRPRSCAPGPAKWACARCARMGRARCWPDSPRQTKSSARRSGTRINFGCASDSDHSDLVAYRVAEHSGQLAEVWRDDGPDSKAAWRAAVEDAKRGSKAETAYAEEGCRRMVGETRTPPPHVGGYKVS